MFGIEFLGLKLVGLVLAGLAGWGIYKNWGSIWPKVNSVDDIKNLWYSVNSPEDILKHLEDAKARLVELIDQKKTEFDDAIKTRDAMEQKVAEKAGELQRAEEVAAKLG